MVRSRSRSWTGVRTDSSCQGSYRIREPIASSRAAESTPAYWHLSLFTTLAAVHLSWPYHAPLVPDRLGADSRDLGSRSGRHPFGRGYVVPRASHPVVADDACPGRILLAEQQVPSASPRPRHSHIDDFVSHWKPSSMDENCRAFRGGADRLPRLTAHRSIAKLRKPRPTPMPSDIA